MMWTDETWAKFFDLLDNGWPGDLDPDATDAYQVLLDGTDPAMIVEALRRLLHRGARFRPSAAEILAAAREDPSKPTADEALELIFGRGGVLAARPKRRVGIILADEREQLLEEARRDRLAAMHPLVAAFVERQGGLRRLARLNLDGPDADGIDRTELRRRELAMAWNEHVEAFDGREVAALASPRSTAGQLTRFDPLAALGTTAPPAAALPVGSEDA